MRILLAGGGGFLGSHLARRLLAAGDTVWVVDNFVTGRRANLAAFEHPRWRSRFRLVVADVCHLPVLGTGFDAVVHLASPASPIDYLRRPLETLDAGALGTRALLEVALRSRARFLLASTSEVYGDPLVHPQSETYWGNVNPVGPRSVYDESKRYAEALASAYARHHGLAVRIARIFNTYGPGMRLDDGRVIPTFVGRALRGEPLPVHGDGSQTRSYCFVGDLVRGLQALLWSDVSGPLNLGNPEEMTILETAERIREITGSASRLRFEPLPRDDPRRRRPDIARARRLLGWEPSTPFVVGLRETVRDLAVRLGDRPDAREPSRIVASGAGRLMLAVRRAAIGR